MGNSVIYRPAYDAEVEYLESDSNSYIDTGLKASSELGILAHIQNSNGNQNWLFGGGNEYSDSEYGFLANYSQSYSYFYFNNQIKGKSSLYTQQIELNGDKNVMTVGSDVYSATSATFISNNNVYLFAHNRGGSNVLKSTGVRIYDFKIYQNSTLVRDFIPVRIGSVGYMYDKVSKQLFANKGTGNFVLGNDVSNAVIPQQRCVLYFGSQRSVVYERIYQEYDWLVGDDAYFGTHINIYQESLYVKFHPTSSYPNHIFWEGFYNISSDTTIEIRGVIGGENELGIRFGIRENGAATAGILNVRNIDFLDDFTIETRYSEDNKVNYTFNGTSGTGTPKIDSRANVDVSVVFRTKWCKFAMVTTDRINLIPVKLLKSIPSKYDANGIARQAGECGMWDKVNDKFYGNVGSGSFTVSND